MNPVPSFNREGRKGRKDSECVSPISPAARQVITDGCDTMLSFALFAFFAVNREIF